MATGFSLCFSRERIASESETSYRVEVGDFQPIDPRKSSELVVRRRNLPHLEVPRATYFATFRCRSSADLSAQARDLVMAAIVKCDQASIDLDAAVIMPDHAHLISRLI